MNVLCRTANRVGALRYSDGNLGRYPDSERAPFRVTVVHTSTEGTIAALRTAAELATGLGAELALLWAEEIPYQYRLHDLPVPIEMLERQLQKVVYLSGIRESQVLTQLLLCRDKYAAVPRSLFSHSVVVIGKSAAWWSRPGKKLEMILREAGHQVVPVVAPRTSLFRGHWNWQILLIRLFMSLTARRVGA
jgi:hypothetical protein